jgi:uncharacterized protein (TIGR03083 family)
VLAASRLARPAGQVSPGVTPIPPVEAFRRAADALDQLLGSLDPSCWRRPVLRDLDVQGLVGHLAGVEEDVQRCLSGDPAVAAADHVTSTQAAAARQAGRPAARTRAEWRDAVDRTLGLVRAHRDPDAEVAVHGLRLPLNALLVVRAFEIWVHDNDIRRVADLSPAVPDAPTLHLMTDLAARLLPRAAAHTGLPGPVSVHLVLTGPGGGTWDVTLGAGPGSVQPGPAPVRIVTDAVGFCQLVASGASPADLDLDITGDAGRATGVLAAAAALALD